jgi:hypothetical protein
LHPVGVHLGRLPSLPRQLEGGTMSTETVFDRLASEVGAMIRQAGIARVSGELLSVFSARTMCRHLGLHCVYLRPDDKFEFTSHERGPPLTPEEKLIWTVIA